MVSRRQSGNAQIPAHANQPIPEPDSGMDFSFRSFTMTTHSRSLLFLQRLMLTMLALVCAFPSQMRAQINIPAPAQIVQQVEASDLLSQDSARKTLLQLPLHFEAAPDGGMASRFHEGSLRIEGAGRVQFVQRGKSPVSMQLDGANPAALPTGQNKLAGHSNYLLGNDPAKWRTEINQFSRVQVAAVYPGIDLVYYGNGDQLEHDYLVAPNADPGLIRMQFDGAIARLDRTSGDLLLKRANSNLAEMRLKRPVAYQVNQNGSRNPVEVSYRLRFGGEIGFSLGAYDHRNPLVIDPVILYSTYFGGSSLDYVQDLKIDSAGNVYFLMGTSSSTLPQMGNPSDVCLTGCGPVNTDNSEQDFYVAKMDARGQQLDFATYIGGSAQDIPSGLSLDSSGNVYISGETLSPNFPVMNAFQASPSLQQGEIGLTNTLTKLSTDGSKLLYSTYFGYGLISANIGGINGPDTLAVGQNGIAYIAGKVNGSLVGATLMPVNPLFKEGKHYVAKFDTTKTGTASLLFASPIGDDKNPTDEVDIGSIAADSQGDLWIYGRSTSPTFPVVSQTGLQPDCGNPCSNGYLLEINPAGTGVSYATYVGGTVADPNIGVGVEPIDMTLDSADSIYVTGLTSQTNYPLKNQAFGYGDVTIDADGNYGFMTKIAAGGKQILYSTLIESGTSGSQAELYIGSVAGTPGGLAAVSASAVAGGLTPKNGLPTPPLTQSSQDGAYLAFDTTQAGASSLLSASYLGSSNGFTNPARVQIDAGNNLVLGGITSATDFPDVDAFQSTCTSPCDDSDGFLIRIQPASAFQVLPSTLTFPSTAVGSSSATMDAIIANGTSSPIYTSQPVLSDTKDFTATGDCSIISPGSYCTVTFTFTPQSSGALTATYSIADLNKLDDPLIVNLSGTATGSAASGSLSPANVGFGSEVINHGTTKVVTYTNSGSTSVTISGKTITPTVFTVATDNCGSTVAAKGSCTYVLFFEPTAAQTYTGTFTVMDGGSNPSVALTGTGTANSGSETLTPTSIDFGTVLVGQTANQTVTYTNNGSVSVEVFNYANTNPAFSVIASTCTVNVAANSSCTYTLQFAPTVAGLQTSTFEVLDKNSNPTATLTGTTYITSPQITLTPNPLNFKDIPQGQTTVMSFTLTNGSTFPITSSIEDVVLNISSAFDIYVASDSDSGYCVYDGLGKLTLPAGASCLYPIGFLANITPDTAASAKLTLPYSPPGTTTKYAVTGNLTANEVTDAAPVVTPTTIQFPATANGKTSLAQIVNVSNTGEQPLGFTSATLTGTNATAFAQTNNCPPTLNKNGTCQIAITFTPGATGNEFTATLDVKLSTGDVNVALAGGTSPSDFILSTPAATQPNPNAAWVINIAPLSTQVGFNEPIKFTVSGLDPSYGTPVFTPSTVTPGSKSVSTTITLSDASAAELKQTFRGPKAAWPILACCMAFFFSFRKRLKAYRSRLIMMMALMLLTTFAATGCGNPTPPPVTFTVTATSGAISHSITLTLQP